MSDCQVSVELPKYKCHKEVWALKIKSLEDKGTHFQITPEDEGYAPFNVDLEYMIKHAPKVGGYYVVYEDGYKSFSPAKVLEEGYTRIV